MESEAEQQEMDNILKRKLAVIVPKQNTNLCSRCIASARGNNVKYYCRKYCKK